MNDVILFLLLGLGIGSLYAMLGAGLVVVYRGSGVINFAHGAMAMYGVFTFDEARRNGYLRMPWVDFLPTHRVNVPVAIKLSDDGVGTFVAIVIALALSVLIGLLVHFLVFRPLRNAAPLGKVIGSVGVMLYLQGVAQLNFGGSGRQPQSIIPDEPLRNFLGLGKPFPVSTLWAAGIALAIGVGLWALFRFTRFGIATRAAAGNEKGAVLLGYSPQFLAAMNWIIAAVVATISAIVVGPIQGSLTPIGLSALVVVALSAALIGGLRSIMVATVGGLLLGAVQSLLQFWSSKDWFPSFFRTGVREAVPLIAIAAVLFLRGKSLPMRGTVEEKRLPLSPRPARVVPHVMVWGVLAVVAAFLFADSGTKTVFAFGLSTSLIAAIIMLSMVVLTGYVGQISLAQLSLSGVAAFFMARMMADGSTTATNPFPVSGPDLPWPIAAVLGVLMAIVVGVLIGLPAVRIRGVQLAVVTLAFAISLQTLYLDNQQLTDLSAGSPANVRPANFLGVNLASTGNKGLQDRPAFTIFAFVVLVLCVVAVSNLRRNGTGRRFLAVRANERAAAAAGISVTRTKLLAFGISAGIAGIGGVMLGFKQNDVSSASFVYQASLVFLAFAYLGGITSINGAIIGGLLAPAGFVVVTSNYFFHDTDINSYVAVLGGASLVFTAVVHPEGIAPFFQPVFQYFGRWLVRARGAEWAVVARRQGPYAVLGAVLGVIVWPLRVDSYSWVWMPLLGAVLAMMIRSIVMRVVESQRRRNDDEEAARQTVAVDGAVSIVETAYMALLETRGLTVRYGGLFANDEVDLEVEEGRLVGLIGPNGAGKTTFIDAITGFTPASSGVVLFDGHDLNGRSPDERAHLGLARTFQSLELFEDLSVRDNLLVAAERPPWYSFLLDLVRAGRTSKQVTERVDVALDALDIADLADRLPSDLSHGQRKLVGVARALAAHAKLLLLDEPAAGLDTAESQLLGSRIRGFVDRGTTVFLIDHDMGLVLNVCDYIYVLDFGRIIAKGRPGEIRTDPAVIAAYLGEKAGEAQAMEGSVVTAAMTGDVDAPGGTPDA